MEFVLFAIWLGASVGLWVAFLIGALALFRWLTYPPENGNADGCWCGRGK